MITVPQTHISQRAALARAVGKCVSEPAMFEVANRHLQLCAGFDIPELALLRIEALDFVECAVGQPLGREIADQGTALENRALMGNLF